MKQLTKINGMELDLRGIEINIECISCEDYKITVGSDNTYDSRLGEIVSVLRDIFHNVSKSEENAELKTQLERAKVYLKATSDLLQKQNESHYVLNLLETTVFYDEADCDGYCLKDEIDTFLETGV